MSFRGGKIKIPVQKERCRFGITIHRTAAVKIYLQQTGLPQGFNGCGIIFRGRNTVAVIQNNHTARHQSFNRCRGTLPAADAVNRNNVIRLPALPNGVFISLIFRSQHNIKIRRLKLPLPFIKPLRIVLNRGQTQSPLGPKQRRLSAAVFKNPFVMISKRPQIFDGRICIPRYGTPVTIQTNLLVN